MKKFWKKNAEEAQTAPETEEQDTIEGSTDAQDTQAKASTPEAEASQATPNVIDLSLVFSKIWARRRLFVIVLPIVFVLSCIHILNVPRYYTTGCSLAPEVDNPASGGGLSSIAASFGFDLSEMQTTDAITPLLYPELMDDNRFIVDLFKIQVTTADESLHCDYLTYLTKHQEKSWNESMMQWIHKNITGEPKPSGKTVKNATGEDPYILNRRQDAIVNQIRHDVDISVDKKTGVISISATAQDPLVCKTLADSVTRHLQDFITYYRTSKAQKDVDYYKHLRDEALRSYETVRRQYAAMSDANTDLVLESAKSELEDMENDMQLKYNQYTTYDTQLQASIAKLREKTPAFTTLKGASVPIKPAGPKRMIFVFCMCLLATVCLSFYAYFRPTAKE